MTKPTTLRAVPVTNGGSRGQETEVRACEGIGNWHIRARQNDQGKMQKSK